MSAPDRLYDRELSWLAFNGRVLQEAADPDLPPGDRLLFLSIFSSNLDEFFRVRVASLRAVVRMEEERADHPDPTSRDLLRRIHAIVMSQQEAFGRILRGEVLPSLEDRGIVLVDETDIRGRHEEFLRSIARDRIVPALQPRLLSEGGDAPFLEDGRLHLYVELWRRDLRPALRFAPELALVRLPDPGFPRFLEFPEDEQGRRGVMFVEDAVRWCLPEVFPEWEVGGAFAGKLTRDADLRLEDEFDGDLVERLRVALSRRGQGVPSRFLYDGRMPTGVLSRVREWLDLDEEDLIEGWRYHNLRDLASFPLPDSPAFRRPRLTTLPHPSLSATDSILDAVTKQDRILHMPYQSFDTVLRFLREAATDPKVSEIWISLYRVSADSEVARALIVAAERGARVTAFIEVKARFDEETNLRWGERLEEAGARVFYSLPGLKVHAKLALVVRSDGLPAVAYLGTGNFNEKTARLYVDHALLTADPRLTREVRDVFGFLSGEIERPRFEHLLVAPFCLRKELMARVRAEIDAAREGAPSGMLLKVNALQDPEMIELLYEASAVGVPIELIVRGICCARPGLPGVSDTMRGRSIVGRLLEHARIYQFENRGSPVLYLASADWMSRNLNRRVEVAFPIYDPDVARELRAMLHVQMTDNVTARVIDPEQRNNFVERPGSEPLREAQADAHSLLAAPTDGGESTFRMGTVLG